MASDSVLLWPPRSCASTGRVALDGPVHIDGPWTDVGRFALRVLDPLPGLPDPAAPHRHIRIQDDPGLPPEGYRLATSRAGTTIAASTPDGVRQAAITLLQLLPDAAWREGALRRDDWLLPEVTIQDAPAFEYRGLMLDVARHFATVTEVLRWIELAALHRLNRLHLHLTDDQGWRIESAAYPRLAEIASWRSATWIGHGRYGEEPDPANVDGTPHGGFYSREDLREIGDHAARHGITLVPEVDLPGHACALLAAIPELGVPGCPPQAVTPFWGLLGRTISPLPQAMGIVETLLGEAADAIPSPYLHIGGDEADLTMWRDSPEVVQYARAHGGVEALRGVVNGQLARFVVGLGRRPIAWDDAFVAGGLPVETVIMPWRSEHVGHRAAAAGHDVIMTPVLPTYFDYGEAFTPDEPLSISAPLTVADVAAWHPSAPSQAGPGAGRILGGQAQLWGEYLPDQQAREYRAFPRLSVLAANLWRGSALDLGGVGDDPRPAEGTAVGPTGPGGGLSAVSVSGDGPDAPSFDAQLARLAARHVNFRPPTGPHPWQRAGTGARAPRDVIPMDRMLEYLTAAAEQAEPPSHV